MSESIEARAPREARTRNRVAALVLDNFVDRVREIENRRMILDPSAVIGMLNSVLAALDGETDPTRLGVDERAGAPIRRMTAMSDVFRPDRG